MSSLKCQLSILYWEDTSVPANLPLYGYIILKMAFKGRFCLFFDIKIKPIFDVLTLFRHEHSYYRERRKRTRNGMET